MGAILNAPVILELGKASRKAVRQLREGRGKMLDDVQDAMKEVTASLGEQAEGKHLIPVVLVYRQRRRRKTGGLLPILG